MSYKEDMVYILAEVTHSLSLSLSNACTSYCSDPEFFLEFDAVMCLFLGNNLFLELHWCIQLKCDIELSALRSTLKFASYCWHGCFHEHLRRGIEEEKCRICSFFSSYVDKIMPMDLCMSICL